MFLGIFTTGNITRDPEVRTSAKGNEYIVAGMAVNDFQRGEEKVHWLNITAMDPMTMRVLRAAKKGSHVTIMGSQDVRAYDKDGTPMPAIDVILRSISFVSAGRRDDTTDTRTPVAAGVSSSWGDDEVPF